MKYRQACNEKCPDAYLDNDGGMWCFSPCKDAYRICAVCGAEYPAARHKGGCCSLRCLYEYVNVERITTKVIRIGSHDKIQITRRCKGCGKEFSTTSTVKMYCSKDCRLLSLKLSTRKGPETAICMQCGKAFEKNSNRQLFCSKTCQRISYGRKAMKPAPPLRIVPPKVVEKPKAPVRYEKPRIIEPPAPEARPCRAVLKCDPRKLRIPKLKPTKDARNARKREDWSV